MKSPRVRNRVSAAGPSIGANNSPAGGSEAACEAAGNAAASLGAH